jgi:hypothetical protein
MIMGYSTWDAKNWKTYSTATARKTVDEIFTKKSIDMDLDPLDVAIRESRDSAANPNSTAIIVACDVTGSMGIIAEHLVRKGIGTFFEELLSRKPISDPHMMIMGIGDAKYDTSPLQVSQFEADLAIAKWLEKVYIEQGGGGNNVESYELPYWFAYNHTAIDCFEKRGEKGFLFTIGDEQCPDTLDPSEVKKFIGDTVTESMTVRDVISQAQRMYHCFHIMIAQGDYARRYPDKVKKSWRNVLGQNAIWLEDYTKLSETLVSLIQVTKGADAATVTKSWNGDTALAVARAISEVTSMNLVDLTPGKTARKVARF